MAIRTYKILQSEHCKILKVRMVIFFFNIMHYAGRDKQFRNNNSQNKEDFEFFAERW